MKTFNYTFTNGTITVSPLKFDRYLTIELNNDENGNKQFIYLDQRCFLTVKAAKVYAIELLKKYNLFN